jgi:hypothetical protein
MFRVVLQDGHDEHKPLEIWKLQHGVQLKMSAWVPQDLFNVGEDGSSQR